MRIVTIIGARPQFIKAAVVSRALGALPQVTEILLHTGQHYDACMSDIFFQELDLPAPAYALGIGSSPHGAQTAKMLAGIERVLQDEAPDRVLVYGDTNSTLAGALAAAKLHLPIAHVEAGLRSFNRRMPEEINRVLTDRLSTRLLAPTPDAVAHLTREGHPPEHIRLVGDVMYDAFVRYGAQARARPILAREGLTPGGYLLATTHRAENTDDPACLAAISRGIARLSTLAPVVMPLHPRTRAALVREGLFDALASAVRLLEPMGYLDMVRLETAAAVIVTDSGGVQKEAFFAGVPCVTLREETEWGETVAAGANYLVGADTDRLVQLVETLLRDRPTLPSAGPYYGKGDAARQIAEVLGENGKDRA